MITKSEFDAAVAVRDNFGAIAYGSVLKPAQELVKQAGKKIPSAYDKMVWGSSGKERGHRIGLARHHEIYDVNPEMTRVLVCVRDVEGTKHGVKTLWKSYYVVARHGRGIRILPAHKAVAAKAAKLAGDNQIGLALEVALGKLALGQVEKKVAKAAA